MMRTSEQIALAAIAALAMAYSPAPERATIAPPPPRLRRNSIPGTYDDNVKPRAPKPADREAMSAAEAKRARKAAKRARELAP